jgi:uncharacterized protein YecE (DUF72 family)
MLKFLRFIELNRIFYSFVSRGVSFSVKTSDFFKFAIVSLKLSRFITNFHLFSACGVTRFHLADTGRRDRDD